MSKWPLTQYSEIITAINDFEEKKYAGTRNFVDGHVSYLSPYISRGLISTKMVCNAIIKNNPKATRGKFVQELLWRDYFQRLLQAKPDISDVPVRETKTTIINNGVPTAIVSGETGITAVDDAIHQLYQQGYMHNHFRMYVAALCCNIGKYGFQEPGKWLYYHLLDADIGSNFASWQWVAGHLTWKTYIANQDNINRYSRAIQEGTFLDKSYKELEAMEIPTVLLKKTELMLHTKLPETKMPECDDSAILIYTFYNLDPQWHFEEKCNRILLLEPSHFEKYPISDKVLEFTLQLSKNIAGLQIFSGALGELIEAYPKHEIIAKEHPILKFESATIEERDWIVPQVSGYYESFSKYYLKCLPFLIENFEFKEE